MGEELSQQGIEDDGVFPLVHELKVLTAERITVFHNSRPERKVFFSPKQPRILWFKRKGEKYFWMEGFFRIDQICKYFNHH